MKTKEKLVILNSITVNEYEADGESLYYANVDNNLENVNKLVSIGADPNTLFEYTSDDEAQIDITTIAFQIAGAKWYSSDHGGFINYVPKYKD